MAITERYVSVSGGGAHDGTSEANAFTWAEMITDINGGSAAGKRYNVKAGSYSRTTTADSLTGAGTSTSPIIIRGYSSAIGDGNLGRTNANGPLVTTNMPVISYTTGRLDGSASGAFIIFESLSITSANTSVNQASLMPGAGSSVVNCALNATGNSSNARAIRIAGTCIVIDCDISYTGASSSAAAVGTTSTTYIIQASRITGPIGCTTSANNGCVVGCTFYGCSTTGINSTGSTGIRVVECTICACGVGITIAAGTNNTAITSCLITDCTTGIDCGSTTTALVLGFNRFDRNTTNIANGGDWVTATSYSLDTTSATQANEYENYAGNDFRLKSGSPARAIGLPSYRDVGALQHQDAGGGGSAGGGRVIGSPIIRGASA